MDVYTIAQTQMEFFSILEYFSIFLSGKLLLAKSLGLRDPHGLSMDRLRGICDVGVAAVPL